MPRIATPPELVRDAGSSGAAVHYRALEALYASAPVNQLFKSRLEIVGEGHARIRFTVDESVHHAAGAAHGTIYFKMLDDAAFYAANAMVTDPSAMPGTQRLFCSSVPNFEMIVPLMAGETTIISSADSTIAGLRPTLSA